MTQSELARLSGVAQTTVGNLLRGSHAPRTYILDALADALGTTVSHLTSNSNADELAGTEPATSWTKAVSELHPVAGAISL